MNSGTKISKVAILADPRDDEKKEVIAGVLKALLPELEQVGIEHEIFVKVPRREIVPDEKTQAFLVLGGDGTMIHFAGILNHYGLPFYGLNYGNVGFMMNNPKEGLDTHALKLAKGRFSVWEFPLLKVRATDLNGNIHKGVGLNDIYLQRMTPQSCRVNIRLDNQPLKVNPILCDGVIVATPLGSTAYNFNTTGSMVAITTPALTMTPIAAHRSCPVSCMMLPLNTRIEFDILEPTKRRVQVVSDGENHGDLTNAVIEVSPKKVPLCFDPREASHLPMRFIDKACS
ncbi:MAG: hypothetical protein QNK37_33465 [Acidobacteriota bacterium]|nr:hypothetical protein [Acidobacteriota bacterium]